MQVPADLIFPAENAAALAEIASWDAFRPATFAASEFPVDVVRLEGSSSPPLFVSRAKRAQTLKALPATLRARTQAAFDRASRRIDRLLLPNGKSLDLSQGPAIMGVVNVTPDSFSDGGLAFDARRAADRVLLLFDEGASIVDVGGESTRPSSYGAAEEIPAGEEIRRVVPVIEAVRKATDRPLSIDTRKAIVARAALDAGADLVNDVSALQFDPDMARSCAEAGAGIVLMHMKGRDPRAMQADVSYAHPVADIARLLADSAVQALEAGVAADAIALDPGLGFGKSPEGNLILLRHLAALRSLGFPLAVGASRKSFVRRFSGVADDAPNPERVAGSLACVAAAAAGGAALVRVHDVAESVRFLRMLRAIETGPLPTGRPAALAAAGPVIR